MPYAKGYKGDAKAPLILMAYELFWAVLKMPCGLQRVSFTITYLKIGICLKSVIPARGARRESF
jgi:hypothetical protein